MLLFFEISTIYIPFYQSQVIFGYHRRVKSGNQEIDDENNEKNRLFRLSIWREKSCKIILFFFDVNCCFPVIARPNGRYTHDVWIKASG